MSSYTITYVVQQTPRGERTLDLYSRLLSGRIVFLGTPVDEAANPDAMANPEVLAHFVPGA